MTRSLRALPFPLVLLLAGACGRCAPQGPAAGLDASAGSAAGQPELTGVSPRSTSNETAQPLLLFGRSLKAAKKLHLGAPFNRDVPLEVVDNGFAAARLPSDLAMPSNMVEVSVPLALADEDGMLLGSGPDLVIVNDQGFSDLQALAATSDLRFAFVPSPTTDEVLILDTSTAAVTGFSVGDSPSAIAVTSLGGAEQIVVAHRYSPELRIIAARPDEKGRRSGRVLPAPNFVQALAVRDGVAYLGERRTDTLVALALEDGKELWRAPAPPSPRGIAVGESFVALGSIASGEVALFDRKTGAPLGTTAPRPGMSILGGHTEAFGDRVMGGRGVRALAATSSGGIFVASAGPNVGPNAEKMSTAACGGVGFVDVQARSYPRHLCFDSGVTQAFALDEKRSRLYAADVSLGLVHVLDATGMASGDEKARKALLSSTALEPLPALTPARPPEDFGEGKPGEPPHRRRAGLEVQTGPSALSLSADGKALLVLERFTGRITRLDVSGERPRLDKSFQVGDALTQADRRRGQVLYFADLGRTAMSCDVCHPEGRGDGVFFTKTDMERILAGASGPRLARHAALLQPAGAPDAGGHGELRRLEQPLPEPADVEGGGPRPRPLLPEPDDVRQPLARQGRRAGRGASRSRAAARAGRSTAGRSSRCAAPAATPPRSSPPTRTPRRATAS
ncbi:MAG: MtsA protein [Myxococcales bacterium]